MNVSADDLMSWRAVRRSVRRRMSGPSRRPAREDVRDEAMIVGLTVTAAQRDKFAKSGVALPDGDFPVHDAEHLAAAKSEFRKGNFAGHSKAEVRAHINKNAKRLGLPGLDGTRGRGRDHGAHPGEPAAMALTGGADSAEAVTARHPELAHLFKPADLEPEAPGKSGGLIGTKDRAHSSDLDEDPSDPDQPRRGGKPHRRAAARSWRTIRTVPR